jgi:hypothetical protein
VLTAFGELGTAAYKQYGRQEQYAQDNILLHTLTFNMILGKKEGHYFLGKKVPFTSLL